MPVISIQWRGERKRMIRNENRLLGALVCNIGVVLLEMNSLFVTLFVKRNFTPFMLIYYTRISSLFAFVVSLFVVIAISREIINPSLGTGARFRKVRYISVSMQAMTMMTVLFVILPSDLKNGTFSLYRYANVSEYLICPVLSLVSLIVFGDCRRLGKSDALSAFIPTFIYGCVIGSLNVFGIIDGPYFFVQARALGFMKSAFWALVMFSGSYGISRLLIFLCRHFNQKYTGEAD